jgi:hypothetical protein
MPWFGSVQSSLVDCSNNKNPFLKNFLVISSFCIVMSWSRIEWFRQPQNQSCFAKSAFTMTIQKARPKIGESLLRDRSHDDYNNDNPPQIARFIRGEIVTVRDGRGSDLDAMSVACPYQGCLPLAARLICNRSVICRNPRNMLVWPAAWRLRGRAASVFA